MTFNKKLIITFSLSAILFSTLCFGQESYLIKNINKNIDSNNIIKKSLKNYLQRSKLQKTDNYIERR